MSNIWEDLDKAADLEGLKKDVEGAKDGGGDFKEVPKGTYEVELNKLILGQSKKKDPMMTVWFKILTGEFENSLIFYNQVLTVGFQIHLASELLRSFDTSQDVKFDGYAQFSILIDAISTEINNKGLEYELDYGEDKGWNTFTIKEVFES